MNPLTDELPDEVKADLAQLFADLKRQFVASPHIPAGLALMLCER